MDLAAGLIAEFRVPRGDRRHLGLRTIRKGPTRLQSSCMHSQIYGCEELLPGTAAALTLQGFSSRKEPGSEAVTAVVSLAALWLPYQATYAVSDGGADYALLSSLIQRSFDEFCQVHVDGVREQPVK